LIADYFVSYRTRLNAAFAVRYEYTHAKSTGSEALRSRNWGGGFSVGISHAIL